MRALLLDMCGGHDLSRQVKPLAKIVEPLWCESIVIVLPRELGLEIAARGQ